MGRPQAFRGYLRKLIGEHGEGAFDIAWEIAQGKRVAKAWFGTKLGPIEVDATPTIREQMDAAFGLIEHLVGKPAVTLVGDEEKGPVRLEVTNEPPSAEYLAQVLRVLEGAGVTGTAVEDERLLAALSDAAPESLPKP